MKRFRSFLNFKVSIVLIAIAFVLYINHTDLLFAKETKHEPLLLSHRGAHPDYVLTSDEINGCSEIQLANTEQASIENTIPAIRAAYEAGAEIVEVDLQQTRDGNFVAFRDWNLDCRTNGTGPIWDYTTEELKQLDIGYGYQLEGDNTYPFRGDGVGLIPTLEEILNNFPEERLLLHIQSRSTSDGERLANILESLSTEQLQTLIVTGSHATITYINERFPSVQIMTKEEYQEFSTPTDRSGWSTFRSFD
ncbi:glycerophosphodiester phosphodiesterase family protein [Halalkalibacterium halodurans]|uniref:glycerophosphodiester phosphodiesterase family protein n=1 Tax=Halalkalibacterium halodurans TaxID=86665 RepID=UPI002AAA1920|nr:glycerophosphodiester phosphodiesterase family protein [Halalkalibacterium halodurans]MDY7222336.1 glycerophosphodiester phosphodiesterase family protein [Halalkalibacterium halodurans]MDY7241557.1 glycerophosphodiester phosphodiesterase family protein [Halalkalibacterium halodurans]